MFQVLVLAAVLGNDGVGAAPVVSLEQRLSPRVHGELS